MGKLDAGDKAPAFTLPDQDGKPRSRSRTSPAARWSCTSTRGTTRPGCTKEACQFNDNLRGLHQGQGDRCSGISADTADKHQKFREKYGLKFPLLTDADHKVGEAYGAWGEKTLYGKKSIGVIRSTFLDRSATARSPGPGTT